MPFTLLEISEALQILQDYEDIFTASNPVLYILRILGWWILKGVKSVLDSLLDLLASAFDILNFSESEAVSGFLSTYSDLMVPLMMITLIVIGILMIVGSDQIKGSKLMQNIALALAVLVLLPTMTSWFNTIALDYADVQGDAMEKGASEILVQNTYDLQYIFEDDEYAERYKTKNVFAETDNPDGIWNIDINEQIVGNDDDVNSGPDDVFEKTYDPAYPEEDKEIDPTRLVVQVDFLTSWYYRYSVDIIPVILIYLVYCIVIAATVFKCARLAYEIVVHQLIGMLLAVTDLATAQRIKKVLFSLLSTYIVLMYAITALVLFNVFVQWLMTEDLSIFKQAVFIAAVALAVIDGPKVIELVFGLDAGIGSGIAATMAAIGFTAHAAKSATSGAKTAKEHLSDNKKNSPSPAGDSSSTHQASGFGESKFGSNEKSASQSPASAHPGMAALPGSTSVLPTSSDENEDNNVVNLPHSAPSYPADSSLVDSGTISSTPKEDASEPSSQSIGNSSAEVSTGTPGAAANTPASSQADNKNTPQQNTSMQPQNASSVKSAPGSASLPKTSTKAPEGSMSVPRNGAASPTVKSSAASIPTTGSAPVQKAPSSSSGSMPTAPVQSVSPVNTRSADQPIVTAPPQTQTTVSNPVVQNTTAPTVTAPTNTVPTTQIVDVAPPSSAPTINPDQPVVVLKESSQKIIIEDPTNITADSETPKRRGRKKKQ